MNPFDKAFRKSLSFKSQLENVYSNNSKQNSQENQSAPPIINEKLYQNNVENENINNDDEMDFKVVKLDDGKKIVENDADFMPSFSLQIGGSARHHPPPASPSLSPSLSSSQETVHLQHCQEREAASDSDSAYKLSNLPSTTPSSDELLKYVKNIEHSSNKLAANSSSILSETDFEATLKSRRIDKLPPDLPPLLPSSLSSQSVISISSSQTSSSSISSSKSKHQMSCKKPIKDPDVKKDLAEHLRKRKAKNSVSSDYFNNAIPIVAIVSASRNDCTANSSTTNAAVNGIVADSARSLAIANETGKPDNLILSNGANASDLPTRTTKLPENERNRNRIAARKSRKKKKLEFQKLEEKVENFKKKISLLKAENRRLRGELKIMKSENFQLKTFQTFQNSTNGGVSSSTAFL